MIKTQPEKKIRFGTGINDHMWPCTCSWGISTSIGFNIHLATLIVFQVKVKNFNMLSTTKQHKFVEELHWTY